MLLQFSDYEFVPDDSGRDLHGDLFVPVSAISATSPEDVPWLLQVRYPEGSVGRFRLAGRTFVEGQFLGWSYWDEDDSGDACVNLVLKPSFPSFSGD